MTQAKEIWITDRCQEIDSGVWTGNSRAAFNTLKLLTYDNKGTLLTEEKAINKRWTEYCTQLYIFKLKTDANVLQNEDKIEIRETTGESGESPVLNEVEKQFGCWRTVNHQVSTASGWDSKTWRARYYQCLNGQITGHSHWLFFFFRRNQHMTLSEQ